ncbi:MAG: hypothetical protein ACFFGZ_09725, partial [Candidatus Thorarchaeota archaeon]
MSSREAAKIELEKGKFDKAAKLYMKSAEEHQEAKKPNLALEDYENAIGYEEKSEKQKKLFDYLKDAFSYAQMHDADRAAKWAKKLLPIVREKINELDPSKKQKDLADYYQYLASLLSAVGDAAQRKSALGESAKYFSEVALKTLDSGKESKVIEASNFSDHAVSLYLEAEKPEDALELRFHEIGINLSYRRLNTAQDVIAKIQAMLENLPPDSKPMELFEAFQRISQIYADKGTLLLEEKKKEEVIQVGTQCFEIAREYAKQGQVEEQIASIWVQQGNAHLQADRINEAFSYYSKASAVAKETNKPDSLKNGVQQLIKQGLRESMKIVDKRKLDPERISYSANPGAILFDKAKEILREMNLYEEQGVELADYLSIIAKSIIERHQNFEIALEYFKLPSEILIEIQRKENARALAQQLAELGNRLINEGNVLLSLSYYETVALILEAFDDKTSLAELEIERAKSLLNIGHFEHAHSTLRKASETFLQLDNPSSAEESAKILFEQGIKLIETGKYDIGLLLSNDAIAIYAKTKNVDQEASNFRSRAEAFVKVKRVKEAFDDFKAAIRAYEKIDDVENIISTAKRLSNVGTNLLRERETEIGNEICEFGITTLEGLDHQDTISEIVFQKALAHREIGNLENALVEFSRSANVFLGIENTERASDVADELLQMAVSLVKTKTFALGEKYGEASADIYESLKDIVKQAEALSQVAIAFHDVQQYEKSLAIHESSINLIKESKNADNGRQVGAWLSENAVSFMNSRNRDLSEKYLNSALDLYKSLNLKQETANAYFNMGTTSKNLEEYEEAVSYFTESIQLYYDLKYKTNGDRAADELCALGRLLIEEKNSPNLGMKSFKSAISALEKDKHFLKAGDAFKALAFSFEKVNNLDDFHGSLKNAVKNYQDANSQEQALEIANKYKMKAEEIFKDQTERGILFFDESITILKKEKAEDLLKEAYNAKGKCLEDRALSIASSDAIATVELSKEINSTYKLAERPEKGAKALSELAIGLFSGNEYEMGLKLAKEAVDAFNKLGEKDHAARSLAKTAKILMTKDQIKDGVEFYSESISSFVEQQKLDDAEQIIGEVEELCKAMIVSGKVEEGQHVLKALENVCEKQKLIKILGELHLRESHLFLERNELETAENYVNRAISVFGDIGSEEAAKIADAYLDVGRGFVRASDQTGLKNIIDEAVSFLVSHNHEIQATEICQEFAEEMIGSGHYSEASDLAKKGAELLKSEEKEGLEASALIASFAKRMIDKDQMDLAYSLFSDAIELVEKDQKEYLKNLASDILQLSFIFRAKGNSDQSKKYLERAELAYSKAGALDQLGDDFCERTKGALANNALKDAFIFAEIAASTLSKADATKAEHPINLLVEYGKKLVGTDNPTASKAFKQASKMYLEVDGNPERGAEFLSNEARNFYEAGDSLTASQVIADASRMLLEANEKVSAGRIHTLFGSFLSEKNDFHDALGEFNKGIEILAEADEEGKAEMAVMVSGLFHLAKGILSSGDNELSSKVADQAKQTATRFSLPQTDELVAAQQDYMDA